MLCLVEAKLVAAGEYRGVVTKPQPRSVTGVVLIPFFSSCCTVAAMPSQISQNSCSGSSSVSWTASSVSAAAKKSRPLPAST